MDLLLGIDIQNKQLLDPATGNPLQLQPVTRGDTLNVILQGMARLSTGAYQLVPVSYDTIKVGIGLIEAAPLQGQFTMTVSGVTTPAMAVNSSPAFIESQLNALSSVAALGGLKVVPTKAPNIFIIAWNVATVTTPITVTNISLFPRCFTRVIPWTQENRTLFLVKLFQAPLAFCDQFALPGSPAVTCVEVRSGADARNEVQRINIPANSQGQFSMTWSGLTTLIVPVSGVTASAVQTALNNLYTDGIQRFSVTLPGTGYMYVEFVGPLAAAAQSLITITMESQPPLITPTGTLPLTSPGFEVALNGAAQVTMRLEIEIITGSGSGTPIQADIVVQNAMLDAGMAVAVDPAWLADQVSAVSVPNNPAQATAVGLLGYQQQVGDTVATGWTVNHNLGTIDVFIGVIDNNTGVRLPDDQYTATILNGNQVAFAFPSAPTLNQYRAIVTSAYATTYLPQLSLTIADIAGLQAALNALSGLGNPVDLWPSVPVGKLPAIPFSKMAGTLAAAQLPGNVALLDNAGYLLLSELPPEVPRLAPDGSVIFMARGSASWTQLLSPAGTLNPTLFPDFSSIPSFGAAVAAVLGEGVRNPFLIQTIQLTPKSEVIGFPGDTLPAPNATTGYSSSQFPALAKSLAALGDFDRELWRVAVNDRLLAPGRTLQTDWGVSLQILRPTCAVEYQLVVEIGSYTVSGSYLSPNWNTTTPVFSQPIVITEELAVHSFGLTLSRALVATVDTISLSQQLYGATSVNETPPASANFALRCRLIGLKAESVADPRGFISYAVVPSLTASTNVTQAQAALFRS